MNMATKSTNGIDKFLSSLKIGEAGKYSNLIVFPVYSDTAIPANYLLLDEALKNDRFTVTEVSDSGRVPELKVINGLDINVLIIDGEELIGAKQNRIVNTTIIIGCGKEVVIPVSCVEERRWAYKSRKFTAGKSHLYADLRRKKTEAVSFSLKEQHTFHARQHEIWYNINEKSSKFSVKSTTGAMQDIFESREKEINKYSEAIKPDSGQIGFIAFIDSEIAGCEISFFQMLIISSLRDIYLMQLRK